MKNHSSIAESSAVSETESGIESSSDKILKNAEKLAESKSMLRLLTCLKTTICSLRTRMFMTHTVLNIKKQIFAEAEKTASGGDYSGAINQLKESLNVIENDQDINSKLEPVDTKYNNVV